MSVEEIRTRLGPLLRSHIETLQLINRLARFPARTGASDPTHSSTNAREELGAEIHQNLKELDEDFELLQQDAEDLAPGLTWTSGARRIDGERERERTDIAAQVARLGENLRR